jgi:hypothetical protein
LDVARGAGPTTNRIPDMAYDEARGESVLVGGFGSWGTIATLHAFDGASWRSVPMQDLATSTGMTVFDSGIGKTVSVELSGRVLLWDGIRLSHPSASFSPYILDLRDCAITYDEVRRRLVLYWAGQATWEWESSGWLERINMNRVTPGRKDAAMTYDLARQRVVLFGGGVEPRRNDTWLYDGTRWTEAVVSQRPALRRAATMAYDAHRQRVVLFGGQVYSSDIDTGLLADTWEWDGSAWTQLSVPGPTARQDHGMAYDSARRRVVLFGGKTAANMRGANDTWEFDGSAWTPRLPRFSPPAGVGVYGAFAPLAFDSRRGKIVKLAGRTYVWEYGPVSAASTSTYGAACGAPTLTPDAAARPWIGAAFPVLLAPVPNNAPAILVLGDSRSSFQGRPLPIDLGNVQMPGCQLHAAPQWSVAMATANTQASASLVIPLVPSLIDASIYLQAFTADPAANPLGLVSSNGLQATFGAR